MKITEGFESWSTEVKFARNEMPIKIDAHRYGREEKGPDLIDLRPLGERCKRMLVTQPPVKEMDVYVMHCCNPPRMSPYRDRKADPGVEMLKSETGITVGQIFEVIERMQREHMLCPNGQVAQLNSDGYVKLQMTIEGSVVLKEDDPALIKKNDLLAERAGNDRAREDRSTRAAEFAQYAAAKRAGEFLLYILRCQDPDADEQHSTGQRQVHSNVCRIPSLSRCAESMK